MFLWVAQKFIAKAIPAAKGNRYQFVVDLKGNVNLPTEIIIKLQ